MMFLACFFLFLGGALAQTTISGTVVSAEDGEAYSGCGRHDCWHKDRYRN